MNEISHSQDLKSHEQNTGATPVVFFISHLTPPLMECCCIRHVPAQAIITAKTLFTVGNKAGVDVDAYPWNR